MRKGSNSMAVMVRLRRTGGRKVPFFRIVASDERKATRGRFLEDLGWYDPKKKSDNLQIKLDRIQYWIGCGAHLSETVRSLLRRAQVSAPTAAPVASPASTPEAN